MIEWLSNCDETPYAAYTKGFVPFETHMAECNEGWSDAWAEAENTFHNYGRENGDGTFNCNCPKNAKGAMPITVSFWEEPYPECRL